MMISRMLCRARCSIKYSITGLPKIGTIGLGKSLVSGRTRIALACSQDHSFCHFLLP